MRLLDTTANKEIRVTYLTEQQLLECQKATLNNIYQQLNLAPKNPNNKIEHPHTS